MSYDVGYRARKILNLLINENHSEENAEQDNIENLTQLSILNPSTEYVQLDDNVILEDVQIVDNVIIEDFRNVQSDASLLLTDLSFGENENNLIPNNIDTEQNSAVEVNFNYAPSQPSLHEDNNSCNYDATKTVQQIVTNAFVDDERNGHDVVTDNEGNTDGEQNDEPSEEQTDDGEQNDQPSEEHDEDNDTENLDREINLPIMEGRKRSIKAQPNKWKKNVAKRRRMEGKAYMGYSRAQEGKVLHNAPRQARIMGAACKSKECIRVKTRNCSEISEEQRKEIFRNFWESLNWDQRRIFVINHVKKTSTKRVYTKNDQSRRQYSLNYFLTVNNKSMQVCKKMFLQTLAIGEYSVHDWVQKGNCGMSSGTEFNNKTKKKSIREDKSNDKTFLKEFFVSLPKLPSHYGRSNSSKLYLETTIRSLNQLFKLYQERCQEENKSSLSRTVFNEMFSSMNLSIHPIKKDKCDLCTQHEVGQLSDDTWISHRRKKDRAREEKNKDTMEAKTRKTGRILTVDLQAVKVCPYVQASAIFFKLKLCCHNFTVYDVVTHQAKCFWFTEIDADMTASTFVSCLMEYLSTDCHNETGPIIIYSDGCTYQNRNSILSNALLSYAVENKIEIIQKFLEVGHTQMECDSVHSCIERKLKGHDIYLPSDYIRITREARTKPFPYEVKQMQYSDFKDYTVKKYQRYSSIRPGKVAHDPVVTDLKAIKYSPDANIYYKLDFDEDWKLLPQRQKNITEKVVWPPMNKQKRKIKLQKWQHLQQLKSIIPVDCHSFFDNLQYE